MRFVARALEEGRWDSKAARALEAAWSHFARLEREIALPAHARIVGIAGPTLGGSYVTPTVQSLARALTARAYDVAVVGHGYRSRRTTPRMVRNDENVAFAGDEARELATALADDAVPVFVGRPRAEAIALAVRHASVVLVDALLQTSPRRLARSLLVVDAHAPWGARRCPPRGDLRAPHSDLLRTADTLLVVEAAEATSPVSSDFFGGFDGPIHRGRSALSGATSPAGEHRDLSDLRKLRVGLVLGIARPDRVRRLLAAHGIRPAVERLFGDHAGGGRFRCGSRFRAPSVDLWLTTAKCATKLGSHYAGAPLFVLDHRVELPDALIEEVAESPFHIMGRRCNVAPCF